MSENINGPRAGYLLAVVAYDDTVKAATYASCSQGSWHLAALSKTLEYS